MGQCFQINVPNTNVTIAGGSGAVEGISLTTGDNVFGHAGAEMILESAADMRMASTGVLGEAASNGVMIGTPGTIQHSAGGGVQIYAGAGISPSIGGPNGPGEPFGPSSAPKVEAGKVADKLNRINDGVKGASDVVGGLSDLADAEGGFATAKAVFGTVKGGWDVYKSTNAHKDDKGKESQDSKDLDQLIKANEVAIGVGEMIGEGGTDGSGMVAAGAGLLGKAIGAANKGKPMSAKDFQKAEAAQALIAEAGVAGGGIAGPSDGPRIHQVAPANIDREVGADMTAKVAGNKTTAVDGKIEYTSGDTITMKAFSKVETSSLTFEAHANIKATMKGLAVAKVESMGSSTIDGKAKVTVSTKGTGKVSADGSLTIETKGKLTQTSAALMHLKAGATATFQGANVAIIGKGKVAVKAPDILLNGNTKVKKKLEVMGTTKLKKPVLICSHTKIQKTLKVGDSCKLG